MLYRFGKPRIVPAWVASRQAWEGLPAVPQGWSRGEGIVAGPDAWRASPREITAGWACGTPGCGTATAWLNPIAHGSWARLWGGDCHAETVTRRHLSCRLGPRRTGRLRGSAGRAGRSDRCKRTRRYGLRQGNRHSHPG